MRNSDKVAEFHRVMGFPVRDVLTLGTLDERELRVRLIDEEYGELTDALIAEDAIEVADALADLLYVVYGTAVQFGIPIDDVFAEVHRSNLTKIGGGRDAGGKALKPAHYQPPNIASVLQRAVDEGKASDARLTDSEEGTATGSATDRDLPTTSVVREGL